MKKITVDKYKDEEIKEILSKYGTVYFYWKIEDDVKRIKGNDDQKIRLKDFFNALKNYQKFAEKLKNTNLVPNMTMLLYGPPGTGKTSLTRAYAKKNEINVCVVESDRLVSSLLGETIKNIRNVIELSADIAQKNGPFVLFFDEIDAIGSERSNIHEVGEIKRAVISFLQTIDRVNNEGAPLAIIGATNHQQLLDSAIWRRFTFHLQFDFPNYELRTRIIKSFLKRIKKAEIKVEDSIFNKIDEENKKIRLIDEKLKKIDENIISNDILMDEVKKQNINGLITLTHGYSGSDIERGTRVALFKAIGALPTVEELDFDMLYKSFKLVGGTAVHVDQQDNLSGSKSFDENVKTFDDSLQILESDIILTDFEGLIKETPKLTLVLKKIKNILEHREGLKNDYHQHSDDDFVNFISILKDISKILKDKNILKH